MSNNLLDIIKQNTQKATQVVPTKEQTAEITRLLQAKSGKAVPQTGAAQVSLAERTQLDSNAQTMQELSDAANMQNLGIQQQAEEQQQQFQLQQAQGLQESRAAEQDFTQKLDNTLQAISQNRGELDLKKDAEIIESAMAQARLANDKYITELNAAAAKQGLQDSVKFKQAMLRNAFGNNLELLEDKIDFDRLASANDRQFREALSDIKINDIMDTTYDQIANLERSSQFAIEQGLIQGEDAARQANLQAQYNSVSSLITGLLQAGVTVASIKPEPPPDPTNPLQGQGQGIRDAQAMDNFLTKA